MGLCVLGRCYSDNPNIIYLLVCYEYGKAKFGARLGLVVLVALLGRDDCRAVCHCQESKRR